MIFANKMDKMGADFKYSLESIKDRLTDDAVAIQWPIGAEDSFNGAIDLVTMKAYHYEGDEQETTEIAIPEDLKEICEQKRIELIEKIADF